MAAAPGRKVTGEGVLRAWDPPAPPLLALSPSLQGPWTLIHKTRPQDHLIHQGTPDSPH